MTLTYGLGILQGQWKRHHSIIRLAIVSSYRQACAKRSHAGIVFTQWSKNGFFAPHWQKCGNTAPKTVKISNLGHKFVPQGRLVCCIFLWNSGRLYASIGSFYLYSLVASVASYKHFSSVRALCHKFLIDPSGETTDWIKKVRGCKSGTDLLYHHAKYDDHGSRTSCTRKSMMFLSVFCHAFELWRLW